MTLAIGCTIATLLVPPTLAAPAIRDCDAATGGFPTFCSIPATPTGVRNATQFKAAVVDTRLAGRKVVEATDRGRFGLDDTAVFAAQARTAANPPAPMPAATGATSFTEEARAAAQPPARRR